MTTLDLDARPENNTLLLLNFYEIQISILIHLTLLRLLNINLIQQFLRFPFFPPTSLQVTHHHVAPLELLPTERAGM